MKKLTSLVLVTIVITAGYFYVGSSNTSDSPIVSVRSGQLRGLVNNTTATVAYRGIPYAAAPVGNRRWMPPVSADAWPGVRKAFEHGPGCVQPIAGELGFIDMMMDGAGMSSWRKTVVRWGIKLSAPANFSEDCLTLSVYAPAIPTRPLPVMVWYHGGGHKFGAGDATNYDGSALAEREVIVVSINYRLGILGFLAHPKLTAESANNSSGNYGTLDQIQALIWVKDNIAAFGGDPNNVLIFGESAGAHSVGQIMASPLSRGLIHKAIAQSGIGTHQYTPLRSSGGAWKSAEEQGVEFASSIGVEGSDQVLRLRAMSAEELVVAFEKTPHLDALSHPVVDGWVMPKSTAATFAAGEQAQIPFMIGTNADEGTLLGPLIGSPFVKRSPGPTSPEDYEAMIRDVYPDEASVILDYYPVVSNDDLFDGINTLLGDHLFGMQAWFAANETARHGVPTWLYFFTRTSPAENQWAGAYHASEIPFVFNNPFPLFPVNTFDDALTNQIMTYWTNFAKRGNPNQPGMPAWPRFQPVDPQEMELGERVGMRPVERREKYEALMIDQYRELGNDPSVVRSMGL
ncbi:MAG: carboxylesterase family protein [Oceanicoccus sp.]